MRSLSSTRPRGFDGLARRTCPRNKKATPGESSGGRTLLSATQVSGLPARPPSLPKRRKDNPEIPPGFLVGLGQSHLSQKIPAATTRCVYLDHLLSVPSTWGSVLLVFVSYKRVAQVLFPSNKIRCLRRSKARLALRSRMASRERLQAERSSRSATVPSASEIPTKKTPTGFSSHPPSGRHTPLTESPQTLPAVFLTPSAIAFATGSETAPCWTSSSCGTLSRRSLASLEYVTSHSVKNAEEPALSVRRLARRPPVQLSASAKVSPRPVRSFPMALSRVSSSSPK